MTSRSREEIQEINQELVLHNKWLSRKGGRRADLSFRDMSGMEIPKIRLAGAKLVGANLSRANLSGCDLLGAELFGADLEGANLTGANLMGADFRGANLHRTVLTDCMLKGADFRTDTAAAKALPQTPAHLGQTVMTEARLERAVLCEANLTGCDMSGADLDGADLSGADLTCTVMVGADMNGANLAGVKLAGTVLELSRLTAEQQLALGDTKGIAEPEVPLLAHADVAAKIAAHMRFLDSGGKEGARLDLSAQRLEPGDYRGSDLSGARLRRCVIKGCNLSGCRFDMADLSYSDFSGSNLEQASLRGVNLRRAVLSKVQAAQAVFDALPLTDGRNWPANLESALLHDADLTNASFSEAVLRNADIGGAITCGTSFHGVDLERVKRTKPLEAPVGPKERRRQRRFRTPKLGVLTAMGQFETRDWSFGGLGITLPDTVAASPPFKRGQTLELRIIDSGHPGGVPASATVTYTHAELGRVSFRFVALGDDLKAMLNAHAPEKHRLR